MTELSVLCVQYEHTVYELEDTRRLFLRRIRMLCVVLLLNETLLIGTCNIRFCGENMYKQ